MSVRFDVRQKYPHESRWYNRVTFVTQEEAEKFIDGQPHLWMDGEEVIIVKVESHHTVVRSTKAEVKLTTRYI